MFIVTDVTKTFNDAAQKIAYEAPSITKIGDFNSTTQHSGTGHKLDMNFSAGTDISLILTS